MVDRKLCQLYVPVTEITMKVRNKEYVVNVNNVLCIHNLTTNHLFVSKMICSGNKVIFKENVCYIYNQRRECIGEANLTNGVYKLNIVKSDQLLAVTTVTSSWTWHRRLGHMKMVQWKAYYTRNKES